MGFFFSVVLVWSSYFITDGTTPWYSQLHEHSCNIQRALLLIIWTKCCGGKEEGKSPRPWGNQGELHRDHNGRIGFHDAKCGGRSFQGERTGPTEEGSLSLPTIPPSYPIVILSLKVSPLPLPLYSQCYLQAKVLISFLLEQVTWMPLLLVSPPPILLPYCGRLSKI